MEILITGFASFFSKLKLRIELGCQEGRPKKSEDGKRCDIHRKEDDRECE